MRGNPPISSTAQIICLDGFLDKRSFISKLRVWKPEGKKKKKPEPTWTSFIKQALQETKTKKKLKTK
jgi:hypothetical protein